MKALFVIINKPTLLGKYIHYVCMNVTESGHMLLSATQPQNLYLAWDFHVFHICIAPMYCYRKPSKHGNIRHFQIGVVS